MFTGRKLPITLAFVVLIGMAFGASCNGFFVDPVLNSISIDPKTPQVNVGDTKTLKVFGDYDDGKRREVKSGVSWSSDKPSIASIDPNTGVLTGEEPGSAVISASAQALDAQATAEVILTGVTSITVDPDKGAINAGSDFTFTFTASNGTKDVQITTDNGGLVTISPSVATVTCSAEPDNTELCSADTTAPSGDYLIKMTYPGTDKSATATLTVN